MCDGSDDDDGNDDAEDGFDGEDEWLWCDVDSSDNDDDDDNTDMDTCNYECDLYLNGILMIFKKSDEGEIVHFIHAPNPITIMFSK